MAFDLGDVVPLTVEIRDSAGALANAGAVALTITLPDGTTASPAVSNPSTGRYQVDYTPATAGRYSVRWVATGANACAHTDAFDVAEATPPLIVSLRDTKTHLNMSLTTTTNDEELRGFVSAATDAVEFLIGPVVVRTYTEVIEGPRRVLTLAHTPVVSVTTIAPVVTGGTTYLASDVDVDTNTGVVRLLAGGTFSGGPWRVTYKAGRTVIQGNIRLATLIIVQHMWRTQRGSQLATRSRDPDDYTDPIPGLGYSIPNRALELLQRKAPMVG